MADEHEGTMNGVGAIEGGVVEMAAAGVPAGEPAMIRMPTSEAEAQAMLAQQLGNDPDRIRQAAEATFQQMQAVADALDVKQGRAPRKTATVTTETVVQTKAEPQTEATPPANTNAPGAPVAPVAEPPKAVEPPSSLVTPIEPAKPGAPLVHPPGYQMLDTGLYTWAPDIWGGLPLHFCPDRTVEAKDRPTLIIGILVAPAYGRNRMGRVVKLPEGARIVVYAGIAWMPIALLARGTEGRPIVYAVPTTIDRSGPIPIVKMATSKDDKIVKYETGDGGHEYGVAILYDPDPTDPKAPRMVSLETLRGATAPK